MFDGPGFNYTDNRGQIPPRLQHGGRDLFVCNRSGVTNGDGRSPRRPLSTLTAAFQSAAGAFNLNQTTGSADDGVVIHVGAQHNEAITTANFFSALTAKNVRVVGNGSPLLRWTAAAGTFLMNKDGLELWGLQMEFCDTTADVTITAPITVTGARNKIVDCKITVGTAAARACTTGLTVDTGADDFVMANCVVWGDVTAIPTDVIRVQAAVKRPQFIGCNIQCATSATTVGPLRFITAAAVDALVQKCTIVNKLASSTVALTGMAGLTGCIDNCSLGIQNATGGATAASLVATMAMIETYGSCPGKVGLVVGATGA